MAVDTSSSKRNAILKIQYLCTQLLDGIADAKQLRQECLDAGFQTGGSDPITDAFLNGANGAFPQLTAADLTAAFAAIDAIDVQLAASTRTHYRALLKLRS